MKSDYLGKIIGQSPIGNVFDDSSAELPVEFVGYYRQMGILLKRRVDNVNDISDYVKEQELLFEERVMGLFIKRQSSSFN